MSAPQPDPTQTMASRRFAVLLVLTSAVGVVAALAAWCFLEAVHQTQEGVFVELPKQLGYDKAPYGGRCPCPRSPDWWWPSPSYASPAAAGTSRRAASAPSQPCLPTCPASCSRASRRPASASSSGRRRR